MGRACPSCSMRFRIRQNELVRSCSADLTRPIGPCVMAAELRSKRLCFECLLFFGCPSTACPLDPPRR